jgi:UDP-N-acetylmuramoylalanine--D-glutamate ligase
MSVMPHISEQSQSFLIVGMGQTGLSCARFLVARGYRVAMMDTREAPPSLTVIQTDLPEVLIKTGGLEAEWLLKADTLVLSPGVDPRTAEIKAAREAGIEIVGDIELFARYANAPVIAITGSNGKSTVTTMVAEMAVAAGKKIEVGGNLGVPALDLIKETAPDFYIVELSSFQLETVESLDAYAAVILNVSPDHMDRYDSVEDYQDAKSKIYSGSGVKVINRDDVFVQNWAHGKANQLGFTLHAPSGSDFGVISQNEQLWLAHGEQPLIAVNDLKIGGKHNVANALAALVLGHVMQLPMLAMLDAIKEYRGLPHRCYIVAEHNGTRWIDDSKATNVGACIAAIEGLADHSKLIVIAGGVGKEQDFLPLRTIFDKYVSCVVLIGQDAKLIANVLPQSVTQIYAVDMDDAVQKASDMANVYSTVLLSPACASFDMFSGYVERGEVFAKAVRGLML